jgi:5-methyltetrahydrofolate--homocysteine methyltransferase
LKVIQRLMAMKEIYDAVLALDGAHTAHMVQAELDQGTDVMTILNQGLIAAMDEVGKRYGQGVFFVPEMLMAAEAMKRGVAILRPHLADTGVRPTGTVVIGTVRGDQHDIGKNLVAMMLECAGFRVINLGVDVGAGAFLAAARQNNADIVAMSALLTTTMPAMRLTISKLKTGNNGFKAMVGGAPVTQAFADQIGADGYSPDAPGAVTVARRLVGAHP